MKRMITPLAAGLIASAACHAAQPAAPLPTNRVELAHGFLETGTSFKMMCKRLEARGADCLAPKLRPNDGRGGLDKLAAKLKTEIDGHFGPNERISIVAFSMGGLVSRYYLQELGGADRCDTFITISSPHHGTKAAWLYPSKGAVQMRPGSGFLEQLERSESKLDKVRVASFRWAATSRARSPDHRAVRSTPVVHRSSREPAKPPFRPSPRSPMTTA